MEKETISKPINDDLLGGIKMAVQKGETLKGAMMALYNAGYPKEEIEESARKYMLGVKEKQEIMASSKPKTKEEVKKEKESKKKEPQERVVKGSAEQKQEKKEVKPLPRSGGITTLKKIKQKAIQNVSGYGPNTEKPKSKFKLEPTKIVLITLLILLIGVLVTVFLFKSELVDFFNNLFG